MLRVSMTGSSAVTLCVSMLPVRPCAPTARAVACCSTTRAATQSATRRLVSLMAGTAQQRRWDPQVFFIYYSPWKACVHVFYSRYMINIDSLTKVNKKSFAIEILPCGYFLLMSLPSYNAPIANYDITNLISVSMFPISTPALTWLDFLANPM